MKRRLNVADEALMSYVRGEIDLKTLEDNHPGVYGKIYFDWLIPEYLVGELVDMWERVSEEVPAEVLPPWRRADWEGLAYLCRECDSGFYVWDYASNQGRCIRCLHTVCSMAESRMKG
jgi:hypothetical protein